MTMFVLRVAGNRGASLHGTVRLAATGETRSFAGSAELVSLIEEWQATHDLGTMLAHWRAVPSHVPKVERSPRRRGSRGPDAAAPSCP